MTSSFMETLRHWAEIVGLVFFATYAVLLAGSAMLFFPKLAKASWNLLTKSIPIMFGFLWLIFVGGGLLWLKEQPWIDENSGGADWVRSAGFFLAGAGIAPLGLWLAHRRTSYLWEQTKNESLRRVTDAFTKAVELLGHEDITVRQGGIYALGRLARETKSEHPKIMDIVSAYIRHGSRNFAKKLVAKECDVSWDRKEGIAALGDELLENKDALKSAFAKPFTVMPIDLEAAIAVIKQRITAYDGWRQESRRDSIFLHLKDIARKDRKKWGLFDLSNSYLLNADLSGTSLVGINFSDSYVQGCVFSKSDLRSAYLVNSQFPKSEFNGADLSHAELRGSDFSGADFDGAIMEGANLRGANLRESNSLTSKQVKSADGDGDTILPENIKRPPEWSGRKWD